MSTLSRQCIDAIKSAALANVDKPFKVAHAIRNASIQQVANPYVYSQAAMDELKAEGHVIKKTPLGWHIEGRKPEDIFEDLARELKETVCPENPTEYMPIEKKPATKKTVLNLPPQPKQTETKATLTFVETDFDIIDEESEKWCKGIVFDMDVLEVDDR